MPSSLASGVVGAGAGGAAGAGGYGGPGYRGAYDDGFGSTTYKNHYSYPNSVPNSNTSFVSNPRSNSANNIHGRTNWKEKTLAHKRQVAHNHHHHHHYEYGCDDHYHHHHNGFDDYHHYGCDDSLHLCGWNHHHHHHHHHRCKTPWIKITHFSLPSCVVFKWSHSSTHIWKTTSVPQLHQLVLTFEFCDH
ncbi:hypothetical protein FHG87_014977 [Trinorchestia longiramus]|nr:hypothetical protein FHG87_014977 [Trinorchestia longiramus]